MSFRYDRWRSLSRRDEEMFKLDGDSLDEIQAKHKAVKEAGSVMQAKPQDLSHCI